ncbi:hypothetical protein SteCoe_29804 [Stentor coeruleus]|uniref:glutathione transferase n=1 Tax=Stentor coeruleus TaxID=5963 RepID=A0A1R2B534_9CILI|nr:hypothetical protein SteCoe_29804 [Stentor coeruleus]
MAGKPILGYWRIRGLAEPIRYMLKHIGIDFEEQIYTQGQGPDFSRSQWINARDNLGLSFPNLPYLIDEDLRISESRAIIQHLLQKHKPEFLGTTQYEKVLVQQIAGVIMDIKSYIDHSCYNPNFNKDNVVQDVKDEILKIAKFLGENKYIIGEQLTWPDFFLFETLEMIEALQHESIGLVSEKLDEYRNRIGSLPGVAERIAEQRLPWNNTSAVWN